MYIAQGKRADAGPGSSVMGAVDGNQYVIADLEQANQWISIERTVTVDLDDTR